MGKAVWKSVSLTETVNVLAGHMTKALPVEVIRQDQVLYVKVQSSDDWICKAVSGCSRGRLPLRHLTPMLDNMKEAVLAAYRQESALADAQDIGDPPDPMLALEAELKASKSALADDLSTPPKKKSRRTRRSTEAHQDKSETQVVGHVCLTDVLSDDRLLSADDRVLFRDRKLRIMVSVQKHRYLYVAESDLDVMLRFLAALADRDGVPHADVNRTPSASCCEWFDVTSGRWCIRDSHSGQVKSSVVVTRFAANGSPLSAAAYKAEKERVRSELLGECRLP